MRSKLLTVAIAAGLGLTSISAMAATKSQQPAKVTIDAATLQQLQAQLATLQAQVADLQAKQEAQADAQVETAKAVNDVQAQASDAVAAAKKSSDKLYYKGVNLTLGGFLAAETIYRTHQEAADVASNWNAIPYKNSHARAAYRCWLRATSAPTRMSRATSRRTSWEARRPPTRTNRTRSTRASATST